MAPHGALLDDNAYCRDTHAFIEGNAMNDVTGVNMAIKKLIRMPIHQPARLSADLLPVEERLQALKSKVYCHDDSWAEINKGMIMRETHTFKDIFVGRACIQLLNLRLEALKLYKLSRFDNLHEFVYW